MGVSFNAVLDQELDVINFRREVIRSGRVAQQRDANLPSPGQDARTGAGPHVFLRQKGDAAIVADDTEESLRRGTTRLAPGSNLTGMALSGGGIRSASFGLGVLQAIDSLSDHTEPHVLDAVDYLSVVSGGGYIGTSVVAGMMQPDYTFPFDSRLDAQETPPTQHLRNYSNFLVPRGFIDYLTSGVLVLRGLLVNAVIVLPFILWLAVLTILCEPRAAALSRPDLLGWSIDRLPGWLPAIAPFHHFVVTLNLALLVGIVLFASAIFASITLRTATLELRRKTAYVLAVCVGIVAAAAVFELQPFVLEAMFQEHARQMAAAAKGLAGHAATAIPATPDAGEDSWASAFFKALSNAVPTLAGVLVPVAAFLIAAGQRLANVAKATMGEATTMGTFKKYASRIAIYLAAVVVPFLLWVAYIYLAYWGIRGDETAPCRLNPYCHVPPLVLDVATPLAQWPSILGPNAGRLIVDQLGMVGSAYVLIAVVTGLLCLFIGPNANSLHNLYRDRLSRAFLFERKRLTPSLAAHTIRPAEVDRWKFSSLKPFEPTGGSQGKSESGTSRRWLEACAYAPYLLVNTAINLEASVQLNKRGRNADIFLFSPLFIGSPSTTYAETIAMEGIEKNLGLATAMATSGAAASANMGGSTIKPLTFSLSLLNIRLGYWLSNPRRLGALANPLKKLAANVGTFFFALESAGWLDEKQLNVYLTDGGHIENLGVYELLRRRCRVILAVDAEADPEMTFGSFVKLQVLARIDLGVRIDLPWQAIRDRATAHGAKSEGPHAAIGVVHYGESERGVLIYVKSSLSGDENDSITDYKRRNSMFPHETTVDQFFSEEQFEVYRALGFHAARQLLLGEDDFGTLPVGQEADWPEEVATALKLLNLPDSAIERIVARV